MSAQGHTSDPHILDRRTLEHDHRQLAALLAPGMAVLDVGCGTGAITVGIAHRVGPAGRVLGIDRDPTLLARARERHGHLAGLAFADVDVLDLAFEGEFDVVTTARTLQWIDRPDAALGRMRAAARSGGVVIALDYSHARLAWEPAPPPAVRHLYDAFLAWRTAHGWDNLMADHLPALVASTGLTDVTVHVEDEIAARGETGFAAALDIWWHVFTGFGSTLVADGFLSRMEHDDGLAAYDRFRGAEARRQHMVLRAVVARRA